MLDEADRLLDLGFQAKLEAILGVLHQHQQQQQQVDGEGDSGLRQTVLTSATLHPGLAALAGLSMKDPVAVGFSPAALEQAADGGGSSQLHDRGGPATAFELPKQLQQRWLEVHARMRLVALIGAVAARTPLFCQPRPAAACPCRLSTPFFAQQRSLHLAAPPYECTRWWVDNLHGAPPRCCCIHAHA